jgi:hypothetical protein
MSWLDSAEAERRRRHAPKPGEVLRASMIAVRHSPEAIQRRQRLIVLKDPLITRWLTDMAQRTWKSGYKIHSSVGGLDRQNNRTHEEMSWMAFKKIESYTMEYYMLRYFPEGEDVVNIKPCIIVGNEHSYIRKSFDVSDRTIMEMLKQHYIHGPLVEKLRSNVGPI